MMFKFADVVGQNHVSERLREAVRAGRVPNGFLLLGAEGFGGLPLAMALAQYLHCQNRGANEACGQCPGCQKSGKMQHPDTVYVYPNNTTRSVTSTPSSPQFLKEWREAVLADPYLNINQWLAHLGIDNKQGEINVRDSAEVVKALSYKPYESNYRAVIIWLAEKMNMQAANKLLKSLEEPPNGTVFILVAEDAGHMLATILSRVQTVRLGRPSTPAISEALLKQGLAPEAAQAIASGCSGNYRMALDMAADPQLFADPSRFFIRWMRASYGVNIEELAALMDEFAEWGRERQKLFLAQAQHTLRKVLLFGANALVSADILPDERDFIGKFAPFVSTLGATKMAAEMDKAAYHIERNGSAKIIFTDLSLTIADVLRETALQKA